MSRGRLKWETSFIENVKKCLLTHKKLHFELILALLLKSMLFLNVKCKKYYVKNVGYLKSF